MRADIRTDSSPSPIVVSHGEGRTRFASDEAASQALATLRYVDNLGAPTERYPRNPNGSAGGFNGFTTADGRFTIMMPHPERSARTLQLSWLAPELRHASDDASPWLRLFRNARAWLA